MKWQLKTKIEWCVSSSCVSAVLFLVQKKLWNNLQLSCICQNVRLKFQYFAKNIARIANAVHCHSELSGIKDCHEFRFSIVRIVAKINKPLALIMDISLFLYRKEKSYFATILYFQRNDITEKVKVWQCLSI